MADCVERYNGFVNDDSGKGNPIPDLRLDPGFACCIALDALSLQLHERSVADPYATAEQPNPKTLSIECFEWYSTRYFPTDEFYRIWRNQVLDRPAVYGDACHERPERNAKRGVAHMTASQEVILYRCGGYRGFLKLKRDSCCTERAPSPIENLDRHTDRSNAVDDNGGCEESIGLIIKGSKPIEKRSPEDQCCGRDCSDPKPLVPIQAAEDSHCDIGKLANCFVRVPYVCTYLAVPRKLIGIFSR